MFDYLIIGAGLFGATFAQQATEKGKTCLIIDKRDHIAGNCYTKKIEGIDVHVYGAHQFHTNSKTIWQYVNRFAEFNHFRAHVAVNYESQLYSMPPNMRLFNQLWGTITPQQARDRIELDRIPNANPKNFEEWVLDQAGRQIYEMFYEGYTIKQWGRHPKELPASIARRLPIRFTWNDRWFDDTYEGIPISGYTGMVENMIKNATVILNTNYFTDRKKWNAMAKKVVYSGKIDEFFDYKYGELEYRSLRFEDQILNQEDYQGNAVVNYTHKSIPYTRIIEHKHFQFAKTQKTVITREYPDCYDHTKIPYYPITDNKNKELYYKYVQELRSHPNILAGGRLANYQYYNMDQVIASALKTANMELKK